MKYIRVIIIAATLLFIFVACGKKNNSEDSIKFTSRQSEGEETNEINVVFSDKEEHNPGVFELKKTISFISGMRYNAKSTAKLVYVAFANYDAKLGLFSVEVPAEPGQIVIVVSFKTENKEIALEQQMDEYVKMKVPTGIYEPAWMSEGKCFQVYYFVAGQSGGPSISDQGATGTATLTTSTSGKVSGSINFTSPSGSTIKGTFNVKVEKDFWETV
jgi:hypothetical protein